MTQLRKALAGPFAGMAAYRQFVLFRLVPSARPSKFDKLPCNLMGVVVSAHDPKNWTDWETACSAAEALGLGVGFVFTAADPFWFLDTDGSLRDGQWSPLALSLYQLLPGVAAEISGSGGGGHMFGTGAMPPHACKNEALGLELYTEGRFVALTGVGAVGDCMVDCTAVLPALVATYFPADAKVGTSAEWQDGPREDWNGPTDDVELIQRALNANPGKKAFEGKATFRDLWEANEGPLSESYPDSNGRPYDASSADAALAQHLAYRTGCDCPRMERLMRQSALVRDKWDSHASYMQRTIVGAISRQDKVLGGDKPKVTLQAVEPGKLPPSLTVPNGTPEELTPDDFWAHLPTHKYINRVTKEMIPVEALNNHLKRFKDQLSMKPSEYLDMYRAVQQMSWYPDAGEIIEGKVSEDGILRDEPKGRIYNNYRPSSAVGSDGDASKWIDKVRFLYPNEAEHIFDVFAYRVQHPGKKINHAIVLGGDHGIGKDWMMEPIRYAVGSGNYEDIEYVKIFDNYSEWAENTLLVINEARDAKGLERYEFYQKSKRIIAAPPTTLPCRKMYLENYYVPNVMLVVITSNNKLNGLYIDPDDRRYFVAWSDTKRLAPKVWPPMWDWLDEGGREAVVGFLQRRDLSSFDPMASPPRTNAWYQIVEACSNPEEHDLSDVMEGTEVATVREIIAKLSFAGHNDLAASMTDKKKARSIPHLLGSVGFEALRNPGSKDGRWVIAGKKETLYADGKLSLAERLRIAQARV